MNNEYHRADGSPRYGHRTEASAEQPAPAATVRVEEAAEGAARLGLDDMAAAIDRRLGSAWADAPDPAVTALRGEHPEELAAARELVRFHLGTQRMPAKRRRLVAWRLLCGSSSWAGWLGSSWRSPT
jgi:hypothetical protein